jgi:hypothetical protein
MFDTPTVPITATYAQSGTTVTVTSTAHGLVTGQQIAIAYYPTSGGISATNGNCTVTVTGANTFTVPDINSNTVTAGTTCIYAVNGNYMFFMALAVGDIYANYLQLPAEGIKAYNNVYVTMDAGEIDSVYVFYG